MIWALSEEHNTRTLKTCMKHETESQLINTLSLIILIISPWNLGLPRPNLIDQITSNGAGLSFSCPGLICINDPTLELELNYIYAENFHTNVNVSLLFS